MSSTTFADVAQDLLHKPIIARLESVHGSPLPEDIQQFLLDLVTASELRIQNTLLWVTRTRDLSQKILSSEACDAEYALFWIYLHEIVDRFYKHETSRREISEQIGFLKPILNDLDALRGELTEEDLVFIQFMRNSHVHMHLHSLWSHAKMEGGTLVVTKPPPEPDPRELADRIIRENENSQNRTAAAYAGRLIDPLNQLVDSSQNAAKVK